MTHSTTRTWEAVDRSWLAWTLGGLAAVWMGVILISLGSPDLVSGSQQEHLPLAAFTTWIWGLIASVGLLWGMSKLRGDAARERLWKVLTVLIVAIWAIATVLSILLPTWETGSDPTQLPLWAILVPLAASLLTVLSALIVAIIGVPPERPDAA